ncbi:MAG: choice-of-anchor J domain-containing protein [Anaerolineales bacterium]
MKIKRVYILVIVSILILGLASGAAAAVNSPVGQEPTSEPTDATGSRGGVPDTTPPVVYVSPANFSEGFDDITNLPEWFMQNNSDPLGLTDWFQGNDTVFPAYDGAPTAYIAANYNNTAGVGTISNWLLTPQQALGNGATFSFWTRTVEGSSYPDRLQVRLSTEGDSTDVGTGAEEVGDFATLLLDINPNLEIGGYPEIWTQYVITLSDIPEGSSGRLAFRYYVTEAGPSGNNSDYIGIDLVEYNNPPSITLSKTVGTEPGICATTDAITVTVGTEVYYCYQITNTGEITLTLHDLYDTELGVILNDFPYTLAPGENSPEVIAEATINATTVNTATWTAFNELNYTYDDSIAYNFEDISGTGTPFVLGDDEVSGALPLGFTLYYFGMGYTDVYASSNGFLTVLEGQSSGCCTGQAFPDPADPNGVIAGWWEDLNPSVGGSLYYQMMGTAPNRYFIVQYTDIQHYPSGNPVTLQYKLFEGSNLIEVHYMAAPSDGGTHSAGLENQDGTVGTQYYLGTAALITPLAVRYTPQGSFGEATATDTALVNVLFPDVRVDPTSFDVKVIAGQTLVDKLTLFNDGEGATPFMLLEQDLGMTPPLGMVTPQKVTPVESTRTVTIGDLDFSSNQAKEIPTNSLPVSLPKAPGAVTITHSVSQDIQAGNSVSCNAGGLHTDNSYLRVFTLTDFGIDTDFSVTNVEIGIEQATGNGGIQPATVNLYTLEGPLLWENLTLIGSAPVSVSDQSLTIINMPVEGVALTNSTLVVEFFTPNGQVDGNSLWVGSNNLGQTGLTYLAAADCGIVEPTDTGAIGFPNMHLVMNVTGEVGSADVPWLSEDPITGTIDADSFVEIDVTFDTMTYTVGTQLMGLLKVKSNDPDEGLITVPITLTVVNGSDLSVSMSDNADPVRVGDLITYTLVAHNDGLDPTTGVMVEDTLPSNVTFESASAGCTHAGGQVTCDIGAMAVGESVTLTIVVTADVSGMATNTAEIWSDNPDPDPLNNIASEDTFIIYNFYLPIVQKH